MSNTGTNTKNGNKGYLITGAIILLIIACVVCAVTFKGSLPGNEEKSTVNFGVKVTCDTTEVVYDKPISVKEGTTLMEAMKENLDVTESDGFITSICGKKQNVDENRYWMYTINGQSAQVGASEYKPVDGDEIVFDLSELSWE